MALFICLAQDFLSRRRCAQSISQVFSPVPPTGIFQTRIHTVHAGIVRFHEHILHLAILHGEHIPLTPILAKHGLGVERQIKRARKSRAGISEKADLGPRR